MLGLKKQKQQLHLKLVTTSDNGEQVEFQLNKTKMLIGRFQEADIRIDHTYISHYHAFINS